MNWGGKLDIKRHVFILFITIRFCHKLKFLIPISLKSDGVDIISKLGFFIVQRIHRIHSLKDSKNILAGSRAQKMIPLLH